MSANKGLSLVEIILSTSLMMLGLTLVLQLLIPLGRYAASGSALATVQQLGMLVMHQLSRDLSACPGSGLLRLDGYWSLQSIADVDPQGHPVWTDSRVLYNWEKGTGRLVRALQNLPSAAPGPPLAVGDLKPLFARQTRPLAAGVTVFEVDLNADSTVSIRLELRDPGLARGFLLTKRQVLPLAAL